jgi:AraC-like DNA-binding protein
MKNPQRNDNGSPKELQCLSRKHEAIALFMLQHPSLRDSEIAQEFEMSPSSLTRLKRESLFIDYYDGLKNRHIQDAMEVLKLKQLRMADSSINLIQERIDTGDISTKDAIAVMTSSVPYVLPKKGTDSPSHLVLTQNNFQLSSALETAKQYLENRQAATEVKP